MGQLFKEEDLDVLIAVSPPARTLFATLFSLVLPADYRCFSFPRLQGVTSDIFYPLTGEEHTTAMAQPPLDVKEGAFSISGFVDGFLKSTLAHQAGGIASKCTAITAASLGYVEDSIDSANYMHSWGVGTQLGERVMQAGAPPVGLGIPSGGPHEAWSCFLASMVQPAADVEEDELQLNDLPKEALRAFCESKKLILKKKTTKKNLVAEIKKIRKKAVKKSGRTMRPAGSIKTKAKKKKKEDGDEISEWSDKFNNRGPSTTKEEFKADGKALNKISYLMGAENYA